MRTFKLSCVKNLEATLETIALPVEKILDNTCQKDYTLPPPKLAKVVLCIYGSQRYRVYDEFEESEIAKNQDGGVTVAVNYPKGSWAYGFILSFGCFALIWSTFIQLNPPYNIVGVRRNLGGISSLKMVENPCVQFTKLTDFS